MKKIDKDQSFAAQVKALCDIAEKCMLRNNQIDMFEEYFLNEESDHVVENISTKTLMLFKYSCCCYSETLPTCAKEVSVNYHGMLMARTSLPSLTPSRVSSRLQTR